MATEGAQLLARGAKVTLADGSEHNLVFDFEALEFLEERWGSLLAWLNELGKGWNGRRMRVIRTGLAAGLLHTGLTDREVVPLIDHHSLPALQSYLDAINTAIDEALPKEDEAPASGKGSKTTSSSTGRTSTTSEPSSLVAATPSSGG